ncbi:MAG: metallophosphoesterase [Caldilineaceae bacterium]
MKSVYRRLPLRFLPRRFFPLYLPLLAVGLALLLLLGGLYDSSLGLLLPQHNTVLASVTKLAPHETCAVSAAEVCFAVLGDFGEDGRSEAAVAQLVKGWQPNFIVALGDNNYPDGSAATIDANIGQYFHEYIGNYQGSYGTGALENRFFPILGNHDWRTKGATPYLDYFTLPGNERYYDFVQGPVHFFALDSDAHEPDGNGVHSVQADWLRKKLATATEPWKVILLHHPPYSSGRHGSQTRLQWPFQAWGADAVLAGHDHLYERIVHDNIPYFVNGAGGNSSLYKFTTVVAGSQVRYNQDYGAMLIEASATSINFRFVTRRGDVIDTYTLDHPTPATPTPAS